MTQPPPRVRVLLISPEHRILLFQSRNTQRSGAERRCWTTPGGGCDEGETLQETALRELAEEIGVTNVRLGPVVWYGEDGHRSGDWKYVFKEHFIVAHTLSEDVQTEGWTEHERAQTLGWRWWSLDELRASDELIYPFNLAARLEPILAGHYPGEIVVLPPLTADSTR